MSKPSLSLHSSEVCAYNIVALCGVINGQTCWELAMCGCYFEVYGVVASCGVVSGQACHCELAMCGCYFEMHGVLSTLSLGGQ